MARRRQRPALAVAGALAVGALLVSGCGASTTASGGSAAAAQGPGTAGQPQQAPAKAGVGAAQQAAAPAPSGAHPTAPAADPRLIAYSAQLVLQTKDMSKALDEARALAGTGGGYLAGESLAAEQGDQGGPAFAKLTLKVPSASFQQTLDQLSALGSVLSRSSQADDLTQQVVDIDSRLKSQQASVDRVRALMGEAKSLADVVSLESELSRREADLESLQRQQQELAARTSLSTIALELRGEQAPPAAARATPRHGFWGSIGGALAGGWHVLAAIVRGLLIGIAASAPFLLVIGPLGWLFRRRIGARLTGVGAGTGAKTTPAEPE